MKTKTTIFQKILEFVGLTTISSLIIYVFISFTQLPEMIPAHFNAMGEITRYGSKYELLIMPLMGIVLYAGLTYVQLNPKLWSVPTTKNTESNYMIYVSIKDMLIVIKVELIGFFLYITHNQIQGENMSIYSTLTFILIILLTMVYYITKAYRVKTKLSHR